jgi:hypothetical protein
MELAKKLNSSVGDYTTRLDLTRSTLGPRLDPVRSILNDLRNTKPANNFINKKNQTN